MKYSIGMIMALLLLFPATAGAHPGDHSPLTGILAACWHLVTEPDHALALLAAAGIAFYVYKRHSRAGIRLRPCSSPSSC